MRLVHRTSQLAMSPIAAAHAVLAERTSANVLLDLSQAAPSYPPAPAVVSRVADAAIESETSRYAPSPGLPELRTLFAADVDDRLAEEPARVRPEDTLITAGCNQAFCVVTSALAEPGDEIIVPVPYYFNHDMWLKLDGIRPVYLACEGAEQPSVTAAEALITERTRALLLVSPGNPTGTIIAPETIHAFFDLAVAHNLVLILDETYRTFRGTKAPAHDLYDRPNWREHLATLHSFSKDLAIPGYRVGGVVAAPVLLDEVLKLTDCVAICAPRIGQLAAAAGFADTTGWRQAQAERIDQTLEVFRDVMASNPGGFALASSGAFFGWVRHPYEGVPAATVVRHLVLEADVLTIPGTAFTPTDEGWLRLSFANLDGVQLAELGDRLRNVGERHPAH